MIADHQDGGLARGDQYFPASAVQKIAVKKIKISIQSRNIHIKIWMLSFQPIHY